MTELGIRLCVQSCAYRCYREDLVMTLAVQIQPNFTKAIGFEVLGEVDSEGAGVQTRLRSYQGNQNGKSQTE
jgi:hypothetical protein